jgi:hypothetical protein
VDRHRRWICVLTVLLYIAGFNGQWRVDRDGALYVALGAAMARGEGYTYQGEAHHWVEPGLPWLVDGSFRLFGPDIFWPLTVAMLAMGLASLWLAYRLFLLHADRTTAVWMLALLAIAATVYRYAFCILTDTPFFLGVMVFLLAYEYLVRSRDRGPRWYLWPILALATLWMVAFRPVAIVFIASVVTASAWHMAVAIWSKMKGRGGERNWVRHLAVAVLVVGSFFAFRLIDPRRTPNQSASVPEEMAGSLLTHPIKTIERTATVLAPMMFEEIIADGFFGVRLGPGITSVISLGILVAGIWLVRRRPLWGIFVAASVAQMLIFLPRERYLLPLLPLLIYGSWRGLCAIERRIRRPWGEYVLIGFLVIFIVPNVAMTTKMIIEQREIPFLDTFNKGQPKAIIDLGRAAGRAMTDDDLLISDQEERILHYFSGKRSVIPPDAGPFAPSASQVRAFDEMLKKAKEIYIVIPADPADSQYVMPVLKSRGWTIGEEIARSGDWRLYRVDRSEKGR